MKRLESRICAESRRAARVRSRVATAVCLSCDTRASNAECALRLRVVRAGLAGRGGVHVVEIGTVARGTTRAGVASGRRAMVPGRRRKLDVEGRTGC